jgi:hypothetical protein
MALMSWKLTELTIEIDAALTATKQVVTNPSEAEVDPTDAIFGRTGTTEPL